MMNEETAGSSGLGRLQVYLSDSDSDDDGGESNNNKKKNGSGPLALPLPTEVLRMFPATKGDQQPPTETDTSLHEGRIRSFPHVRGNWASYIYIPYSNRREVVQNLNCLVLLAMNQFKEQQTLYAIEEKHLTLSRTLIFRHHWIDSFVNSLKKAVASCERFELCFEDFEVYLNEEKTRTFIGLKVITSGSLLRIVENCDVCLADFQLEPYYKNPSFHISCAWMLGDTRNWAKGTLLPYLNGQWHLLLNEDSDIRTVRVEAVELKTGNQVYQFPLFG